ncbi:PspA/IM30 family protein [bacterium]|jgi:phage shock protein A|nr:PspA/IM30 family protein [bacterium]
MPYFSRLTDIVTCNLSSILARAEDQKVALEEIVYEMKEGVSGAERSVNTASQNVTKIEVEIGEQHEEIAAWMKQAQQALSNGQEVKARQALERKHEVEDLIAGLEQQLEAAISTRDHLRTMMNALQARLADAKRRMKLLASGEDLFEENPSEDVVQEDSIPSDRKSRVEAELEALRQQMEK